MTEVVKSTYREIHIPANDLVSFMQAIHSQRRVGTLTVSFGTGGVPRGMLIWREQLIERIEHSNVESTGAMYAASELAHHPA